MRALVTSFIIGLVLMVGGCRADAIDAMARTTVLVDKQFSEEYREAAGRCLRDSDTRPEYETCLAPWEGGVKAVRSLWRATLALDVAGRKAFKGAACRWYRKVGELDATSRVELPAAKAALESKWRRKC